MLTCYKETPSLCWRVRSGLVQAGGQRWGSSTTALVVAERTRHQSSPSQETIRVPFLYLCLVIALLRNIYSSQLPEVKVWTSELERLGDGSEHSLRLCRRHLSCGNCFHHLSTSVLSVLPSTWTSHAKKFSSLFVCLFLASHRQNVSSGGWGWGDSKSSSVLIYHWILHLNGAQTQQTPDTCNQLPAPAQAFNSHTLWEVVAAVFALTWGNPWEELVVTSSCLQS